MKKITHAGRALIPLALLLLLLSGCRTEPTYAVTQTASSEVTQTEPTEAVSEPVQDTAEPAVTEEQTVPLPAVTDPAAADPVETEPPEPAEQLPPAAQIDLRFAGSPNIYDYIPCSVNISDPSGTCGDIADSAAKIKIRGHSTSGGEKVPYNFKLDEKTELLGLGKSKKWALLANLYDRTQLRNLLALNFARTIGLENTSQCRFAEVSVNGAYEGLYLLCEPIDVGSTAVDIDTENGDFLMELEPYAGYENYYCLTSPRLGLLLGCNEPEMPTGAQWNQLVSFMTAAEDALLSDDWERVLKYFDVESFARCYIVQELFKNIDYAVSSTRFYIKDGKLYEGPVWDFDLSAGNCSPGYYPDYNNVGTTGRSYEGLHCRALYNAQLFEYGEFCELVSDLYLQLQPDIENLYRDNERGENRIDFYVGTYRAALDRNAQLWDPGTAYSYWERKPVDGTYDAEIVYLREWLEMRNRYLLGIYGMDE